MRLIRNIFRRHFSIFAFCAIAAVAAAVYLPSLHSSFHFDDFDTIVNANLENAAVSTLISEYPTRWLVLMTFKANAWLHGLNVIGYHLVNLALHVLASFLVYSLFRLLWRPMRRRYPRALPHCSPRWIPLLAGLIFAVHPLQSQAVIYISQRFTLAASVLCLVALCSAARGYLPGRSRVAGWCGAAGAVLAGVFCKETIVIAPLLLVIMVCIFYPLAPVRRHTSGARIGIIAAAIILPVIAFLHLAHWDIRLLLSNVHSIGGPLYAHTAGLTRYTYALTQTTVLMRYVMLYLLPLGLQVDPDIPLSTSFLSPCVLLSCTVIVGTLAFGWWRRRTMPLFLWGVAVFYLALLPQSSIIPTPDLMFEHRAYLGVAGLIWATMSIAGQLYGDARSAVMRYIFRVTAFAVVVAFGILTWQRCAVWTNELTLWADAYKKAPVKQRVVNNFANALMARGNVTGAIGLLETSLPCWTEVLPGLYMTLGTAYAQNGELDKAAECLRIAVRHDRTSPVSRYNLALIFQQLGRRKLAVHHLRMLLRYHEDYADALLLLGLIYSENPREHSAATNCFSRYLALIPNGPGADAARARCEQLAKKLSRQRH